MIKALRDRNGLGSRISRMGLVVIMVLFFCPLVLSAAQPQRVRHDLLSVTFPTDSHGWACGRWGTILHTTDGGKTWGSLKSGTDYTLTGIHFIDQKQGWAVGDQGTILHTKDGGATWTKQESPVPYFLMAVQFVNARKGFIVTERTTILATDDGGTTWKVQFKDQDFILRGLSFCDELNGWAVGEYGFTYHTENGGKTWVKQAGDYALSIEKMEMIGGNFLFDVVAVNPKTAWVAGIDGYVARTDDGGKTWVPVTGNIPKRHLFGIGSDKQGGIVIGGDALLLRKTEGAAAFSPVKTPSPITYGWFYRIVPRGKSGLVAVGKGGWIYLSDNSGTNWQKVAH